MRGAFTEIFRTENLVLMTPGVCRIMDSWLEELKLKTGLKNKDGSDGLEYVDYNISKVSSHMQSSNHAGFEKSIQAHFQ